MSDAAQTLAALAPGRVGLQLTAGCAPSPINIDCPMRTHHGFTYQALRARVWDGGTLVWHGDSVHPPKQCELPDSWQPPHHLVIEPMYPHYAPLPNAHHIPPPIYPALWPPL